MIRKRGDRFQAVLKSGREHVAAKTFDTRRQAEDWLARERASLRGGTDPRAGRISIRDALDQWRSDRQPLMSAKTIAADKQFVKVLPISLTRRSIASITDHDLQRLINRWSARYAEATVRRHRAQLSSFFNWAIRQRLVHENPVARTRVPKNDEPPAEMRPFTREELDEVVADIATATVHLSKIVLFLALTGLRFGEAREVRVRDLQRVPLPRLTVSRSNPEGGAGVKKTKSGRARHVVLSDEALELALKLAQGKGPEDLLLTTRRGAMLHHTAFKRATAWSAKGRGRRLHDLRHTAACLWLEAGLPITTVKQYLGHASVTTTEKYLHYLGDDADRLALQRLNDARGDMGVTKRRGDLA